MTKLEINIRENNGAPKESAPYIGHAISKGSKNFIALTEEAAALCGLPAIQVEAILRGAFAEFAALEKDGAVRINFDGGSVSQVIKGTFLSSDAAFDKKRNSLELAWHLSEDVRHHLVNETPRIVSELTSTKVRLDTVADEETPRPYNVIHGRKPFKCTGINLVMSDIGAEVYLENALGVKHPCEVIETISKQEFTAKSESVLDGGDYKLVVRSRGGDAEGPMQTAFRKVKYLYIDLALRVNSVGSYSLEEGTFSRGMATVITGEGFTNGFEKLVIAYTGEDDTPVEITLGENELAEISDSEIRIEQSVWTDTPFPKGAVTFTVHAGGKTASGEATAG